ncbi:MAG: Yip1 family protein [Anaerolineales bacterium]|jgi:hypothetical protein
MSEEIQALSIVNTWIKAITSPNEEAYQQIARNPGASFGKSALWIFVAGMVVGGISGVVNYIRHSIFGSTDMGFLGEYGEYFQDLPIFQPSLIGVITGIPLYGIVSLVAALIVVGLIYFVSRALGGVGSYEMLFNTTAAYQVPVSVITAVVSAIPVVGCLSIFVGIYGIVLGVIANKVVMGYDMGKAVVASVVIPIVIAAIFFGCVFVILGAAVGAVYQDLINGMNSMP